MNSNYLHVFLLCQEHDACSLHLGAMIMGMSIFIGCGYGSHTRMVATYLPYVQMDHSLTIHIPHLAIDELELSSRACKSTQSTSC